MDEIDRLRRLVFDQTAADEHANGGGDWLEPSLDPRTLALVRLGALVAVGGSRVPSYGSLTDAALDAGASVTDVVDVLLGVLPAPHPGGLCLTRVRARRSARELLNPDWFHTRHPRLTHSTYDVGTLEASDRGGHGSPEGVVA